MSDLAGLLGMLKRVAGRPTSTGSGPGAGASVTGLGLEAAMNAMDKDHSGQVSPSSKVSKQTSERIKPPKTRRAEDDTQANQLTGTTILLNRPPQHASAR